MLENEGFQTGALYATGGVVLVALVVLLLGGGPRRNPWAGLVFAGATLAGLAHQDLLPGDLITALFLVALMELAVELGARLGTTEVRLLAGGAAAAAPGAWGIVDVAEIDGPAWVAPALFATVVVGTTLAADFDRWAVAADGWTAGLSPVLLAVTAGGVWATVPETEHAVVLVGAAVPVVLLGWPRPLASLGGIGAGLVVSLVAWTSAVDGIGRSGAVVGGFACLGMFLLGPVLRRFGMQPDRATLLVGHIVVVGLCSRVAGLSDGAVTALVFSVLAYLAVGAGTVAWSRRRRI